MAELTREDIERLADDTQSLSTIKLCNLALKGLEAEKLTEQRNALLVIAKEVQAALGRLAEQELVSTAFNSLLSQVNAAIAVVEGE